MTFSIFLDIFQDAFVLFVFVLFSFCFSFMLIFSYFHFFFSFVLFCFFEVLIIILIKSTQKTAKFDLRCYVNEEFGQADKNFLSVTVLVCMFHGAQSLLAPSYFERTSDTGRVYSW